jgi:hypothetical protein
MVRCFNSQFGYYTPIAISMAQIALHLRLMSALWTPMLLQSPLRYAVIDARVGADDSYNTDVDTTLIVAASGVLANDTDIDSPSLLAILLAALLGELT